ncbi:hypothetical protein ILUMI_18691 [Ignelater luminosus]|uniref:Odorant receptor n=1 Tax=Ignelater luminosus TaxID=2038154 RepID=A0A8K0CNQ0_IGNLU|nr:hypothetical protein ILUMI_18691 [Ignelater luminosus]
MVVVTYRNQDFTRLIQMTKLFWDPSKCDEQIKMELTLIRRFTYQLQRLLLFVVLIAIVLVGVFPLLQNTIPTGIWTMEGHEKLYRCVMICQVIILPVSGLFICFLDCLYLGFCSEIVIQFRILAQYLQALKADGNTFKEMEINLSNEIKDGVRHHVLILRFVKKLRQAFSLVLLIEFIIDGPMICAELLAAFESRSYQTQVRHLILFTIFFLQLVFFCIPANYVTNEAMAVADAVYFSKWYSQHIFALKVPLLLIIQNSQNEITIKAGDLVTINAGTIVNDASLADCLGVSKEMANVLDINELLELEEIGELFPVREEYTVRYRPDHFNDWSDLEFFQRFRLAKDTVQDILNLIEGDLVHPTNRLPPEAFQKFLEAQFKAQPFLISSDDN